MKLLITGKGKAGSWIIRGEQLGKAMGATVKPNATLADMRAHDAVLVIKRVPDETLLNLWRSGVPWIYDIVDAYPQPLCSVWTEAQCKAWLRDLLKKLKPNGVIFPNRKMREDWGVSGGQVVYHHHRPDITQHKPPERIRIVGYEGSAKYLDEWLQPIMYLCTKRKIEFRVNPTHIADLDVVLAMRGGEWDGYAQRNWKSNVKLANAHAAGLPFIGLPEAGYQETACGAEYWAEDVAGVSRALDWLDDVGVRQEVAAQFKASIYSVEQAAADMWKAIHAEL